MSSRRPLWTIVLAGGDGTRLKTLTRALHGEDLPKQFAMIREERSLLQSTLDRTRLFCPDVRTLVIVAREREDLARTQLAPYSEVQLISQPRNLGTAAGILLSLTHLAARSATDLVAVVPSDHFIADHEPYVQAIVSAADVAARTEAIVLVGATADRPEPEYGWIVPAAESPGPDSAVERFVEKPEPELAAQLLREGALWNTFLFVAPIQRLFDAIRRRLPQHVEALIGYQQAIGTPRASAVLASAYDRLPAADFSRDVLAHLSDLRVVPLSPCGWSDWGTPERVFRSLEGTQELERLRARLAGSDRRVVASP